MKRAVIVAGLGLGLLAGCFKDEPAALIRVGLKVLPGQGGTAFVDVDTLGRLTGGHLSGDSVPIAHQDTGSIPVDEARQIFAAAAGLGDTLLRRIDSTHVEPPGSSVLGVLFSDGTQARVVWPTGQEHPDPRVAALAQQLSARRIGGW